MHRGDEQQYYRETAQGHDNCSSFRRQRSLKDQERGRPYCLGEPGCIWRSSVSLNWNMKESVSFKSYRSQIFNPAGLGLRLCVSLREDKREREEKGNAPC